MNSKFLVRGLDVGDVGLVECSTLMEVLGVVCDDSWTVSKCSGSGAGGKARRKSFMLIQELEGNCSRSAIVDGSVKGVEKFIKGYLDGRWEVRRVCAEVFDLEVWCVGGRGSWSGKYMSDLMIWVLHMGANLGAVDGLVWTRLVGEVIEVRYYGGVCSVMREDGALYGKYKIDLDGCREMLCDLGLSGNLQIKNVSGVRGEDRSVWCRDVGAGVNGVLGGKRRVVGVGAGVDEVGVGGVGIKVGNICKVIGGQWRGSWFKVRGFEERCSCGRWSGGRGSGGYGTVELVGEIVDRKLVKIEVMEETAEDTGRVKRSEVNTYSYSYRRGGVKIMSNYVLTLSELQVLGIPE